MTDQSTEQEFEVLLEYLRRTRGFDFSAYKPPSLMRRIQKRIAMVGVDGFTDYLDYLQVHPAEFQELFNMILINVTYFFRDEVPWEYIEKEIVPRILESKGKDDFIRVWSAGCASGEEAYTIAMVLAEALGKEKFQERVKIYATDLDEAALAQARAGAYSAEKVGLVPKDLLEKYFEKTESRYTFRKDFRRNVIFGHHNLIQDAPISRVDLLICRNTLMYFNSEAQTKILVHFHFALNETGYLFLGKSEMLLTRGNLFQPIDLKRRIFKKVTKVNLRDRLLEMSQADNDDDPNQLSDHVRLREAIFEAGPLAQIVVDVNGLLVVANQQARSIFGLNQLDQGRLLQDLDISYKPVELRSLIEQAYTERSRVSRTDIEWTIGIGDLRVLEVEVAPLVTPGGGLLGAAATFTDVTQARRLEAEIQRVQNELETAYEELQSTIEELETTNEELQSTNEELETMNEEQQSTNEELQAMNEELQSRSSEVSRLNLFLESILSSVRVGVIVLDRELRIQMWNRKAEDLWGLRADEAIGEHFLNLDISLGLEQLRQPIKAILSGEKGHSENNQKTLNRRGKPIHCRITMVERSETKQGIQGVILLMEELQEHDLATPVAD